MRKRVAFWVAKARPQVFIQKLCAQISVLAQDLGCMKACNDRYRVSDMCNLLQAPIPGLLLSDVQAVHGFPCAASLTAGPNLFHFCS